MFDFDIGKLMVVAIVALAVIPPKDLPRVMRTVGQFVGRMRRMAAEFQGQFMDAMREADLESVRKELEELKEKAKIQESFDPVTLVRDDVTKVAEQAGIGTSTVSLEGSTMFAPETPTPEPSAEKAQPPASEQAEAPVAGGRREEARIAPADPVPAKQSAAE